MERYNKINMQNNKKIIFISFVSTILFLRLFVYIFGIKTGVLWGIRNIIGDYYPHHIIYGIIMLAIAGYIALTFSLNNRKRKYVLILFGVGLAFIIDELLVTMYVTGKYSKDFAAMYYDASTYIPILVVAILLLIIMLLRKR